MIQPLSTQLRGLRGPILTIDGSLAQTGWALTAETGLLIQSGVLRSKSGPGWPADHRIYAIGWQLMQLWPKLWRKPKHFGIEHQFFRAAAPGAGFQLRPEVVADLARLEGVCVFIAKNSDGGIDVLPMTSTQWRGLLGITGKDGKSRGVAEVRRRLYLSCAPPNELDFGKMEEDQLEAIGLGMALHHELTHSYPLHHRRAELKTQKKARRARAKLPKRVCGICSRQMSRPGITLEEFSGPVEVHAKCRPKKSKKPVKREHQNIGYIGVIARTVK